MYSSVVIVLLSKNFSIINSKIFYIMVSININNLIFELYLTYDLKIIDN